MPKNMGRAMTVREVHELWARRQAGETVTALARELGCTNSNLRLRWKKVGIDVASHDIPRGLQRPEITRGSRIWSLRQMGKSYAEIAVALEEEEPTSFRTLNRLQMRLRRFCERAGVPMPVGP